MKMLRIIASIATALFAFLLAADVVYKFLKSHTRSYVHADSFNCEA